jgi:hypothetical protein
MQGFPLEDPEDYQPLLPNSPEGSPEGLVDHEVASEVGSTHSLEGFRIVLNSLEAFYLPINPTFSVVRNPRMLWMNSSGEIVVDENFEVPTGPNVGSGVEDPHFHSEYFRTSTHTIGTSNPNFVPLTVHDLYSNLGASPNRPIISQVPETYVTYIVPLDHFTGTTSGVTTVSDQILIGSHSIPTLQMDHSTMVLQATIIPIGNVVISQAPIGTPIPSRLSPSLPPRLRLTSNRNLVTISE